MSRELREGEGDEEAALADAWAPLDSLLEGSLFWTMMGGRLPLPMLAEEDILLAISTLPLTAESWGKGRKFLDAILRTLLWGVVALAGAAPSLSLTISSSTLTSLEWRLSL